MSEVKHTPEDARKWRLSTQALPFLREKGITRFALTHNELDVLLSDYANHALDRATAPELLAEAIQLLKNAKYQDGQAIVLTQDCEALEAAIAKATGQLEKVGA